jgi:hypothetical protein
MNIMYFDQFAPSIILSYLHSSPPLHIPSRTLFTSMSFSSSFLRFWIWEKTYNTCLCETGLFDLTWWLWSHPFSCKWHSFFFPIFKKFHLFICAYNDWVITPSSPTPSLYPHPLASKQKLLPLSQFCWRVSVNINKEDQGFLLVEVRIAI